MLHALLQLGQLMALRELSGDADLWAWDVLPPSAPVLSYLTHSSYLSSLVTSHSGTPRSHPHFSTWPDPPTITLLHASILHGFMCAHARVCVCVCDSVICVHLPQDREPLGYGDCFYFTVCHVSRAWLMVGSQQIFRE